MSLSVILPAHNEAAYLDACLSALLASDPVPGAPEVIVVANGCSDATADVARGFAQRAAAGGWTLRVIETAKGGKLNALNLGDGAATHGARVYLDADVVVAAPLMAQIARALTTERPRYVSGTPDIAPARSAITRVYGRFWRTLPFVTHGVPGFGLFAVNAAGRTRWGAFPEIISDDTFVRLQFAPDERLRLPARYSWPLVEGFSNLVRVRRRQNRGVGEIAARFPDLLRNDDTPTVGPGGVVRRALKDPLGLVVYVGVAVVVKLPIFAGGGAWDRGR